MLINLCAITPMPPTREDVFRAVSDSTRRRLLDLLAESDRSVVELARPFRMSQPAISQHLRVLRQAGLVRARRKGRSRVYRINPAPLKALNEWAARYAQLADPSGHVWRIAGPKRTNMKADDLLIKRFESPDEVRTFEKGRFEIVRIGGMTVGRARYEPGWKWSLHVRPVSNTPTCQIEHVGLVLSGQCAVLMDDGRQIELRPGELFHIGPGHDSWVVGDEPYVSLHFLGADTYATNKS
jgi:DNA-binding transcriptional ArsR family regulator